MPRRSQEHLAMRREQVLAAARRCFARDGFHSTTMADVVRESGMSAGAVYRYFPSKASLVVASAHGVTGPAHEILDEMVTGHHVVAPHEVLRAVLANLVARAGEGEALLRLAVSAWGEALRDDELADDMSRLQADLRSVLRTLVERWARDGAPGEVDAEMCSQVLMSAVAGFMQQRLVLGHLDVDRYCDAFAALSGAAARSSDAGVTA